MERFIVLARTTEGRQQRLVYASDSFTAEAKARQAIARTGTQIVMIGVYRLEVDETGVSKEL
jgi:hypothetical protein